MQPSLYVSIVNPYPIACIFMLLLHSSPPPYTVLDPVREIYFVRNPLRTHLPEYCQPVVCAAVVQEGETDTREVVVACTGWDIDFPCLDMLWSSVDHVCVLECMLEPSPLI